MSTFNNVFAEEIYLKGELLTNGLNGTNGTNGLNGSNGTNGTNGTNSVVSVDGTTTVITGDAGADGADGEYKLQEIQVLGGVVSIVLPDPSTVTESGLYYYKNNVTETDTTFTLQSGIVVGKFYALRTQHMLFLKSGNLWIN